jgi:hypothetical protein
MSTEEAMRTAINWCIENNILKDFLRENATEVINMLFAEWKLEDALVVERKEGREEAVEQMLALIKQGITSEEEIRKRLSVDRQHSPE